MTDKQTKMIQIPYVPVSREMVGWAGIYGLSERIGVAVGSELDDIPESAVVARRRSREHPLHALETLEGVVLTIAGYDSPPGQGCIGCHPIASKIGRMGASKAISLEGKMVTLLDSGGLVESYVAKVMERNIVRADLDQLYTWMETGAERGGGCESSVASSLMYLKDRMGAADVRYVSNALSDRV